MKILITGASGLLGSAYAKAAVRRGHTVTALHYKNFPKEKGISKILQLDLTQTEQLTALCLELWPDVIVNCAAISEPKSVESDPKLAEKVNVALPSLLAQLSTHLGSRLLHLSSDMVFDGENSEPYRSTDIPNPTNLYAQTKLLSEKAVLRNNREDPVVLRIPILMGNSLTGQRSVHEKLIASIHSGEQPRLFTDELRQPCTASNVAEVLLELSERRDLHGIFHWAGSEIISRFEMGKRILKHFGLPLEKIKATSISNDPIHAGRPANLSFDLSPIVSKLKTKPVSFEAQLQELTQIEPLNA